MSDYWFPPLPRQAVQIHGRAADRAPCRLQVRDGLPLPDPKCTTRRRLAVLRDRSFRTGCVRNCLTSQRDRSATYRRYGIQHPRGNSGQNQICELYHLVPLEMCGPAGGTLRQRYFKQKDVVENYLTARVKDGSRIWLRHRSTSRETGRDCSILRRIGAPRAGAEASHRAATRRTTFAHVAPRAPTATSVVRYCNRRPGAAQGPKKPGSKRAPRQSDRSVRATTARRPQWPVRHPLPPHRSDSKGIAPHLWSQFRSTRRICPCTPIHVQDEEAVHKWEEYQQQNRGDQRGDEDGAVEPRGLEPPWVG